MPKITLGILTQNRLPELQRTLRLTCPWVDRTIVIDGFSTDGTVEWLQSKECRQLKIEWECREQHLYQYGNHNPDKRNPYIFAAGDEGWMLVHDDDEMLYSDTCENIRSLIFRAEKEGYDGIKFKPHDIWYRKDGSILRDIKHTDYWSPMLWKIYPGQKYVGHTHVRIDRPGAIDRWLETDYYYYHTKAETRMWRNSTQNYWTTVGLATNNTDNNNWKRFHLMMDKYGYFDWHVLDKEMEKGNLPQEIKDWFIEHREDENPEMASWFIWYFIFLHPEENINNIKSEKWL